MVHFDGVIFTLYLQEDAVTLPSAAYNSRFSLKNGSRAALSLFEVLVLPPRRQFEFLILSSRREPALCDHCWDTFRELQMLDFGFPPQRQLGLHLCYSGTFGGLQFLVSLHKDSLGFALAVGKRSVACIPRFHFTKRPQGASSLFGHLRCLILSVYLYDFSLVVEPLSVA